MSHALRSLLRLTILILTIFALALPAASKKSVSGHKSTSTKRVRAARQMSHRSAARSQKSVAFAQAQSDVAVPIPYFGSSDSWLTWVGLEDSKKAAEPAALLGPCSYGFGTVWRNVRPPVPPTSEDELVVAAVGDIMLGSTFPESDGSALPPQDGLHLLDEIAPFLKAADLSIGNLEGPLYDGNDPSPKCKGKAEGTCYAFRVPTRYAKLLADAGFVAMGVANNHAKDFGVAGQESTISAITQAGIAQSGAVGVVAHFMVKGKKVSYIAFATYPQFNNALDIDASTALVEAEANLADYVIVSFHGGAEGADRLHVPVGHEMFLGEDRGDLRTFTHAMIDAGASMVFGHGPHVVRGMEIYRGHLIAYSLGNFATYGHINVSGVNGLTLVLTARLGPGGEFLGGTIHPAYQEYPGGPHVDPKGQVLNVIRILSHSDFGKTAVAVADDGAIVTSTAPATEKIAEPATPASDKPVAPAPEGVAP